MKYRVWVCVGVLWGALESAGAELPVATHKPVPEAGLPAESRGALFLTKIRYADPDYRVVLMACLKERELNLLLSRHITSEEIPILAKGLLSELSKHFPGDSLSVVAFRPVLPLREAGVARLNGQTGVTTYTSGPATVSGKGPGR